MQSPNGKAHLPSDRSFGRTVATYQTDRFINNYLKALDTSLAREAYRLYSTGRHRELVRLSIDPSEYQDFDTLRRDLSAVSLLSKARFLSTKIDKAAVAIGKFRENETSCAETNRRIRNDMGMSPQYSHLISRMQYVIRRTLGDFNVVEFVDKARWGPGASTRVKRSDATFPTKFLLEKGGTALLATVARESRLFEAYPHWDVSPETLVIEPGNRVTTVPKNAKTDRVIAVEPGLNIWFQLAVGEMMRRRLRLVGINLDDQTRNQELAREGSLTGSLATIDFSSASDTISRELVRRLFETPGLRRWLTVMEMCRSHFGSLGNSQIYWSKFSSMGNGFTFELETLIFYAASLAVCEHLNVSSSKVGVYGDDVVIPTEAVPLFEEFTRYLGFKFNLEKSFSRGHFRESCGEYYFLGVDCKPIFLRERISSVREVYKVANSIRRQSYSWGFGLGCDSRFRSSWLDIQLALEPDEILPASYGYVSDSALVMNLDESMALPPVRFRPLRSISGFEGWLTLNLRRTIEYGPASRLDHHGVYLAGLRYLSTSPSFDERYRMKYLDAILRRFGVDVSQFSRDELRVTMQGMRWDMHPIGLKTSCGSLFINEWLDLGPWVNI